MHLTTNDMRPISGFIIYSYSHYIEKILINVSYKCYIFSDYNPNLCPNFCLIDTPDSHLQIFSPQSRISQQYWIMTYCMFTILQIHVIVSYKINYNRWIKWAAASNSIENIVCWWWFCSIYLFKTPFALDVAS